MKTPIKIVLIMWMAMIMGRVSGRLVNVGGKEWWKPGVNFTEWTSHESFYVGDWLGFKFEKYQYDVVEVNETGYKECNNNYMIANITTGAGRDIYLLKEARTYYFICTKGYCWNGMKVAINVTLTPPPAPSPQGNHAYYTAARMPLLVLSISLLLMTFI